MPRPKLAPKVALVRQIERRRQPVVRLLERLHPEPVHVLHRLQPPRRPRAKRRALHARVAQLLDDVREDVLDRAQRRAGELQSPLDLEAVDGRELREDDERTDLPGASADQCLKNSSEK